MSATRACISLSAAETTNNLRKLAFLLAIMGNFQAWYLIIATKRVYSAILFAVFMGRFSFREVTEHSRLRMRAQIISVWSISSFLKNGLCLTKPAITVFFKTNKAVLFLLKLSLQQAQQSARENTIWIWILSICHSVAQHWSSTCCTRCVAFVYKVLSCRNAKLLCLRISDPKAVLCVIIKRSNLTVKWKSLFARYCRTFVTAQVSQILTNHFVLQTFYDVRQCE